MRLIRCEIENFGKLTDCIYEFKDGLNIICQDNSWGKTTLAVFIRVMFYGFENEGKNSVIINERKHYAPWQGGTYGGKIIFEVEGKQYTLSRIFGKKAAEDVFELRETVTNIISNDYTSDIGKELFMLDSASFLRTVCISQNDCATGTTDIINANLTGVNSGKNDIDNYEKAADRLKKLVDGMNPGRKTGSLNREKLNLTEMKEFVKKRESNENSIAKLKAYREGDKNKYQKLKKEQAVLKDKQNALSIQKDIQAKKKVYENICADWEERNKNMQRALIPFPKGVPDAVQLREYMELSRVLEADRRSYELHRLAVQEEQLLSELKVRYAKGVPDSNSIEEMLRDIKSIQAVDVEIAANKLNDEDIKRLKEYRVRFEGADISQEKLTDMIDRIRQKQEKEAVLSEKQTNYALFDKVLSGSYKRITGIFLAMLIIGILLLTGGMLNYRKMLGIACVITGVVVLVCSVLVKKNMLKKYYNEKGATQDVLQKEIEEDEAFIKETDRAIMELFEMYNIPYNKDSAVDTLYGIKNDYAEYIELVELEASSDNTHLIEKRRQLSDNIRQFIVSYGNAKELSEADYSEAVYDIEKDIAEYKRLINKKSECDKARNTYDSNSQKVRNYVLSLGQSPWEDMYGQLSEISTAYMEYSNCRKEFEDISGEKALFEKEHDISLFSQEETVSDESIEDITNRIHRINEELEAVNSNILSYDRSLDELYDENESIVQMQALLDEREAQFELDMTKYNNLVKTKEYLEKAKTQFTSKYTKPVMDGFKKYCSLLTNSTSEAYHMDANINLTLEEKGMQRDIGMLSEGTKDLAGICMRMAFADAIFKDMRPFILMDDPFVNFDENKTLCALNFLEKIKDGYQIIYFTCHPSRC